MKFETCRLFGLFLLFFVTFVKVLCYIYKINFYLKKSWPKFVKIYFSIMQFSTKFTQKSGPLI